MSILSQLSSQVGDRTEASNRKVVEQYRAGLGLLAEISLGLNEDDPFLVGDCA